MKQNEENGQKAQELTQEEMENVNGGLKYPRINRIKGISKIKPRECPLIKFKRHSFFFFIDKIHKLCCNGRPCFRYNWCAVHLSPLLVLDLISTWSNRIYSPPDSRGRSARVCRSSLVSVCKSVISS